MSSKRREGRERGSEGEREGGREGGKEEQINKKWVKVRSAWEKSKVSGFPPSTGRQY